MCNHIILHQRGPREARGSNRCSQQGTELPPKQEGWQPPCRECEPFCGVRAACRVSQDPAPATPPQHSLRHPGSQPGLGQTLHIHSNSEQCLLGILLGSFWAISPCKHKTHSAQVVSSVDQESMGSFMSQKPCACTSCSFGSNLE